MIPSLNIGVVVNDQLSLHKIEWNSTYMSRGYEKSCHLITKVDTTTLSNLLAANLEREGFRVEDKPGEILVKTCDIIVTCRFLREGSSGAQSIQLNATQNFYEPRWAATLALTGWFVCFVAGFILRMQSQPLFLAGICSFMLFGLYNMTFKRFGAARDLSRFNEQLHRSLVECGG